MVGIVVIVLVGEGMDGWMDSWRILASTWLRGDTSSPCGLLEKLQVQDSGWVLENTPTVCGYLVGHSDEIFHLVTSHAVDDFFQPGAVLFFFFFGLALAESSHLH